MYQIILSIFLLFFTVLAWRNLRLGLFVLAALLPTYLLRFSILAIPTTALELMILIVFGITVIKHPREILSLPLGKWRTPIALFLIAATIAILIPTDHVSALGIWKAYFLEPILLFFVLATVLTTAADRLNLVKALSLGAIFVSIVAIFQFLTGAGLPIPWDIERRTTSIFPYPNAVGLYLGPITVIAALMLARTISVLKFNQGWKPIVVNQASFWLVTTLLGLVAMVTSQSEAAVGAVVVTLFIASLFWKKTRQKTLPLAAVVILIALVAPQIRTPFFEKITLQDYSGSIRLLQWEETKLFLLDHPLQGAGLNGFPEAVAPYHSRQEIEIFQYPHNILLNFWVELGLFGLVVISWLIAVVVKSIPHTTNSPKRLPLNSWLAITAGFALLEMFIHGLVDVPYLKNDLAALTWILLSLIFLAHARQTVRSRQEKN